MHKHEEIKKYLLEQIQSGIRKPGDRLETEEELARFFEVSRPTVRQALKSMEEGGYLCRIKGSGSFVAEPKLLHTSTSFIASYRQEAEQQGHTLKTEVIELERVRADETLAAQMGIKKGTPVTRLVRVRRITECHHGSPVVYTIVYVPVSRFPDMTEMDFAQASLYDTLEKYGLGISHVSRRLEVRRADDEVCTALETGSWEPVIMVTSTGYLKNGEVIEYAQSYYPADSSQFLIEIQR